MVDANKKWCQDALEYLSDAGIEGRTYPDLITAMKALNNTNGSRTLVFVDLNLARNSSELFKILSNRTVNPHLYAIVLFPTQLAVSDIISMRRLGAYDSDDKPYGRKSTIETVQRFINEIQSLEDLPAEDGLKHLSFDIHRAVFA